MIISIRKACVLLAIIFSLAAVSPLWAEVGMECDDDLSGKVTFISEPGEGYIYIYDETTNTLYTVYGVPTEYLKNKCDVKVNETVVTLKVAQCPNTGEYVLCEVTDPAECDIPPTRDFGM